VLPLHRRALCPSGSCFFLATAGAGRFREDRWRLPGPGPAAGPDRGQWAPPENQAGLGVFSRLKSELSWLPAVTEPATVPPRAQVTRHTKQQCTFARFPTTSLIDSFSSS